MGVTITLAARGSSAGGPTGPSGHGSRPCWAGQAGPDHGPARQYAGLVQASADQAALTAWSRLRSRRVGLAGWLVGITSRRLGRRPGRLRRSRSRRSTLGVRCTAEEAATACARRWRARRRCVPRTADGGPLPKQRLLRAVRPSGASAAGPGTGRGTLRGSPMNGTPAGVRASPPRSASAPACPPESRRTDDG